MAIMSRKQAMAQAAARKKSIAEKRRPLEESGQVPSQWGKVTAENRLIDNGHLMRSGAGARQNYLREQARNARKDERQVVIRIEKK